MNVLMIGWELPPHNSGGLGVACMGLTKALSKKGTNITFVLPKSCEVNCNFMNVIFADIEEDSELFFNSYKTQSCWECKKYGLDPFPPGYVKSAMKYAQKMKKIAAKLKADVIHCHDWMTYPAAIAAKEALGVPLVAHIHNTVFDRGCGGYNPFEYNIEKEGFEKADRILSVSEYTRNILVDKYGVDKDKIEVVYNGVEETKKKLLPRALKPLKDLGYKIVLYLGRITMQKGPDYFISAARKVLDYNPKVLFIMVGSGEMQEQIMTQAAGLGIMDKVIFTGFLRGEEKDAVWQAADLFVMPSVSEPFGIVALESVANRTPVLVSRQSGVAEVLNHALKVDFWDVDEMANKMLAVLYYDSLGADLRSESAKEIVSVNWDRAADRCMAVYSQLAVSK